MSRKTMLFAATSLLLGGVSALAAPEDDKAQAAKKVAESLKALMPQAASSTVDEWKAIGTMDQPSLENIENQSLSVVMLTIDPKKNGPIEFETNDPLKLVTAISKSQDKGYGTMLQPEFITECVCSNVSESKAVGTVKFEAKGLYRGKVEFTARKRDGAWRIEEFRLPGYAMQVRLGSDGKWKKSDLVD